MQNGLRDEHSRAIQRAGVTPSGNPHWAPGAPWPPPPGPRFGPPGPGSPGPVASGPWYGAAAAPSPTNPYGGPPAPPPYPDRWHHALPPGGPPPAGLGNEPPAGLTHSDLWSGGPPPPGTGWGLPPVAPQPRRRGIRLVAILASVATVIVMAVVGVVAVRSFAHQSPTSPSSPPVPTAPTTAGAVNFTIVNNLNTIQITNTATISSVGKEVGVLRVDRSSPTARIQVSAVPPRADYQLTLTMVLADAEQHQVTLHGSGSITVSEGAVFSVQFVKDAQGNYVATLQPEQGGTT